MKILKIYKYFKFPKYAVFKGVQIDDRAYFTLVKNLKQGKLYESTYSAEEYSCLGMWDRSKKYELYKENMFIRIWTFKQLLKAARILKPKQYSATRHKNFWKPIKDSK